MAELYAVYIAEPGKVYGKNTSLNCQLISSSVIQIHSFCLVRYYDGLALIVLVLMVGEADGQDFFSQKKLPISSWFRIRIHGFRFGFAVSSSEVEYETGKFKSVFYVNFK